MNRASALVECFFLSCRVQHKRVEDAFFAMLAAEAGALGHTMLRVAIAEPKETRSPPKCCANSVSSIFPRAARMANFAARREPFENSGIVELSVADSKIVSLRASA